MAARQPMKRDDLPATSPVFAVSGVILMAGGTMPLMVFEPRYLAMVDDALGQGRLLAMIQPRDNTQAGVAPGLHDVGTLARVTSFGETTDGRYLITVTGISRFRVAGEAPGRAGYRRVQADYDAFPEDLTGGDRGPVDRRALLAVVGTFLAGFGMHNEMAQLEKADDPELVARLAMACPFSPAEKQDLLEAASHAERCRLMIAMIERELVRESGRSTIH